MLHAGGVRIGSWETFDPAHAYGVKPPSAVNGPLDPLSTLHTSAGPALAETNVSKPWHPDSPLFWVGTLLAVTFGLIAASTSVRVGPVRASVAAGTP